MALISYISIPVVDASGALSYVRINLDSLPTLSYHTFERNRQ